MMEPVSPMIKRRNICVLPLSELAKLSRRKAAYMHSRLTMVIQVNLDMTNHCTGFDLSGCPGGIHALKFVRPTQD